MLQEVVTGFAVWTLLAHATVLFAGSLDILLSAASLALVLRFLLVLRPPRGAHPERDPAASVSPCAAVPRAAPPRGLRIAVAASACGLAATYALTRELQLVWLGSVVVLAVAAAWELSRSGASGSTVRGWLGARPTSRERACLWGLAAVCALVPLFLDRPDVDDAFYLSMAVAAADHPGAVLLAHDTVHGLAAVPFAPSFYKLGSFELLVAAFARISPLRVLDVAHVVVPFVGGALVALAHARLLRLWVPGRWLWATAVTMCLLLGMGDTHQSYGNFAFVRLHQGKGLLLAVGMPLLLAFSLEFAARPTRRRWALLAAAQVAALGLSSTALWLAPASVGMAIASATRPTIRGLRTLALGVASSAYVLGCGLAIHGQAVAQFETLGPAVTNLADASLALSLVLGTGAAAPLWLAVLVGSWSLARSPVHRALASLYALGFLLVFWNPYTSSFVAAQVAGYPTYWRVFWLLPLPALAGAALSWPLESVRARIPAIAAVVAGVIGLAVWAPTQPVWSSANGTRVAWPGWKAPEDEMRAARLVVAHASPDDTVLAPFSVSPWIDTLHRHPRPLVVRRGYLALLHGHVSDADLQLRVELAALVSGRILGRYAIAPTLARGIERFDLVVVCLTEQAAGGPGIRDVLRQASFEPAEKIPGYEIWARPER